MTGVWGVRAHRIRTYEEKVLSKSDRVEDASNQWLYLV